ncbi:MAG: hypothetical protein ACE5E0_01120 [Terriglobia bacterium]
MNRKSGRKNGVRGAAERMMRELAVRRKNSVKLTLGELRKSKGGEPERSGKSWRKRWAETDAGVLLGAVTGKVRSRKRRMKSGRGRGPKSKQWSPRLRQGLGTALRRRDRAGRAAGTKGLAWAKARGRAKGDARFTGRLSLSSARKRKRGTMGRAKTVVNGRERPDLRKGEDVGLVQRALERARSSWRRELTSEMKDGTNRAPGVEREETRPKRGGQRLGSALGAIKRRGARARDVGSAGPSMARDTRKQLLSNRLTAAMAWFRSWSSASEAGGVRSGKPKRARKAVKRWSKRGADGRFARREGTAGSERVEDAGVGGLSIEDESGVSGEAQRYEERDERGGETTAGGEEGKVLDAEGAAAAKGVSRDTARAISGQTGEGSPEVQDVKTGRVGSEGVGERETGASGGAGDGGKVESAAAEREAVRTEQPRGNDRLMARLKGRKTAKAAGDVRVTKPRTPRRKREAKSGGERGVRQRKLVLISAAGVVSILLVGSLATLYVLRGGAADTVERATPPKQPPADAVDEEEASGNVASESEDGEDGTDDEAVESDSVPLEEGAGAGEAAEAAQEPAFTAYEYKDPFQPLTGPVAATAPAEETTQTESRRLSLEDITVEEGVKFAAVKYGGVAYKVKEGDRVGDSPYQVVSVGDNSSTLLFGDEQVSLQLGEEIVK